jgi:catechol-2,3-dioxygenase
MAYLRHLALRCRDVETSRRFYEEVIGFTLVGYRSDGVSVDLTDGTLNITLLRHDRPRPALEEGEEYIHFGILVDALEPVWKRLRAWGAEAPKTVKMRTEIAADRVPDIAFKTFDPDGNIIDISSDRNEWRGVRA